MLLKITEFRDRIANDMDRLVSELQRNTHRYGYEEEQSWRISLPRVGEAFASPSFANLDLYFGEEGNLALEYHLPAAPYWADMVLLGRHCGKPAAVIVELKNWVTQGDQPGSVEGLMLRHGREDPHPSDQAKGYTEYCQRYHSAVQDEGADVHGCVIFTKDPYYHSYQLAPNHKLTADYPCFSVNHDDVAKRLPEYFARRLTEPDRAFAERFERGVYQQSRSFVRQIGQQILQPDCQPFVLIGNQRHANALVQARVAEATLGPRPKKTVIIVEGPPGSGKSVIAAKTWASLVTDPRLSMGNVVVTTTSASQSSNWRYLFHAASKNSAASGAVVKATAYTPATTQRFGQLRKRFADAFKPEPQWRENLSMLRSLETDFRSGSKDNEFLVSIVDEAHALINPEHAEGRGQYGFATAFGPQAYHIIRCSTVSVFLLDPQQGFRDRENTTVDDIRQWAEELGAEKIHQISLAGNQFRCAGSLEYVNWVDRILDFETDQSTPTGENVIPFEQAEESLGQVAAPPQSPYGTKKAVSKNAPPFAPFELRFFDDPFQMEDALRQRLAEDKTARLLASYSREWKTGDVASPHNVPPSLMDFHEPIVTDGQTHHWSRVWNYVPANGSDYTHYIQGRPGSRIHADPLCEVGCPYAVRGFDFDYVGILWMSDLVWRDGRWQVNPEHIHETGTKRLLSAARKEKSPHGPAHQALARSVQAAYRILLTRPIKGLYLWCEDEETNNCLQTQILTYINEIMGRYK